MGSVPGWDGELLYNSMFSHTYCNMVGPSLILFVKRCSWIICGVVLFQLSLRKLRIHAGWRWWELQISSTTAGLWRCLCIPNPGSSESLAVPCLSGFDVSLLRGVLIHLNCRYGLLVCVYSEWLSGFSQLLHNCGEQALGMMCMCGGRVSSERSYPPPLNWSGQCSAEEYPTTWNWGMI